MLLLVPRLKHNYGTLKATYYCKNTSCDLNVNEILEEIEMGKRIEIDFESYNGKYKKQLEEQKHKILLKLIEALSKHKGEVDRKLFFKVFKAGGFIPYIRALENQVIHKTINDKGIYS